MARHHPTVDFKHWSSLFPIETFEKTVGPRHFKSAKQDDPTDLWKAYGSRITSPSHLCQIELVRRRCARNHDLGKAVPVDLFLWSSAQPVNPYLTKLGGVPHREADKPWPLDAKRTPYTFVAQFCFADSHDVISERLPGEVMLVFLEGPQGYYMGDPKSLHIEWSNLTLKAPMLQNDCPPPTFTVPQLSGVIYRTNEFPQSRDVFRNEGHCQSYLFPVTQATKIGRETRFIQHDQRTRGRELFCVLNSLEPTEKWPFIDLEHRPDDWEMPNRPYGWGKYNMMLGDVGCVYFLINESGKVSWVMEC